MKSILRTDSTHRECHVKREVDWSYAATNQGTQMNLPEASRILPKAGRSEKGVFPRVFKENMALLTT